MTDFQLPALRTAAFYLLRFGPSVLAGALGALLMGCQPAAEQRVMTLDFEDMEGWMPSVPSWLTTANVHSGRYACLVARDATYAATRRVTFDKLANAQKLRLRTWCWLPNGRTRLEIVLEGARESESLFRKTLRVSEGVNRFGQWEPVEADFTLPADLLPTDYVKLYIYQREQNSNDSYFDDLTLDKLK